MQRTRGRGHRPRCSSAARGGVLGSVDLSWSVDKELDSYLTIYGSRRARSQVGWKRLAVPAQRRAATGTVFGKGYDKVGAFRASSTNFAARDPRRGDAADHAPTTRWPRSHVIEAAYAVAGAAGRLGARSTQLTAPQAGDAARTADDACASIRPRSSRTASRIGAGTASGTTSTSAAARRIGDECIVGEKTYIAYGVRIGDRVKINALVYICTGVTIEDGVMVAAGTIFTNDRFPRATTPDLRAAAPVRRRRAHAADAGAATARRSAPAARSAAT